MLAAPKNRPSLPPAKQRLARFRLPEARSIAVMMVICSASEALSGCTRQSDSFTSGCAAPASTCTFGSKAAASSPARAVCTWEAVLPAGTEKRVRSGDQVLATYSVLPIWRLPSSRPSMRRRLSGAGAVPALAVYTSSESLRLYSGAICGFTVWRP